MAMTNKWNEYSVRMTLRKHMLEIYFIFLLLHHFFVQLSISYLFDSIVSVDYFSILYYLLAFRFNIVAFTLLHWVLCWVILIIFIIFLNFFWVIFVFFYFIFLHNFFEPKRVWGLLSFDEDIFLFIFFFSFLPFFPFSTFVYRLCSSLSSSSSSSSSTCDLDC